MIECDICKKTFRHNYLLMRHLNRKFPCQPSEPVTHKVSSHEIKNNPKSLNSSGNFVDEVRCDYCHKYLSRGQRLTDHTTKCHMKNDAVRMMEIQLKKNVFLNPESHKCRFCNKECMRIDNLKRHEMICKSKENYRRQLINEIENSSHGNITINNYTTNITNNNLIMNYDHDYAHISLDQIIKCLQVSKEKRENALASLGRFIRDTGSNDKSIILSNMRSKTVKAYEDGKYVTKDARHVISHRGQEAAYRLDSAKDEVDERHQPLWRNKDFGDIESSLSYAVQNPSDKEANEVLNSVKMAIYDTNHSIQI